MAHEPDKSIGAEETFARDVDDPDVVRRELLRLCERTAARLRDAGLVGRTISIKVRFADFTTITRSRTLRDPTDVAAEVFATARGLFDALGLDRARLRLIGVRVEGLAEAETAAAPDAARRPGARPARGRAGRRPGHCSFRVGRRAAGQPGDRRQLGPTLKGRRNSQAPNRPD